MNIISERIQQSVETKKRILSDEHLLSEINDVAQNCAEALCQGIRIYFCGNGGSAADAQHLAAELSGRYLYDRPPLPAEALHVNTSYLTAVANDYSYDEVYSRVLQGIGHTGDVLIAISTSGNSGNILRAIETAQDLGMIIVGMTGRSGGKMKNVCDFLLNVPSDETPRIQESHIMIGHIICEIIESTIFPQ